MTDQRHDIEPFDPPVGLHSAESFGRDSPDPVHQMIWKTFDTGKPLVGRYTDDGEFVVTELPSSHRQDVRPAESATPRRPWWKRWFR